MTAPNMELHTGDTTTAADVRMLLQMPGKEVSDERVNEIMEYLSHFDNHFIALNLYLEKHNLMLPSRCGLHQLIYNLFASFDVNKDGVITLDDLRKALFSMGHKKLPAGEVEAMFGEADINGDGRITFNEFYYMIRKMYSLEDDADDTPDDELNRMFNTKEDMFYEASYRKELSQFVAEQNEIDADARPNSSRNAAEKRRKQAIQKDVPKRE